MSDENLVFNGNAFTDKSVAGNFTPLPDGGALLDFDKSADASFIADFAAVKIHETVDANITAKFYIRGD